MIPEVNPYNNYRGDGVATLFDYDFFIQNGSQLIVEHIDKNDVVTRLEENIDYEIVVIEEEFAGYIKFPIEDSKFGILQENETLSLQLTLPFEQISEYGQSSLLDLNSIEFSLDYLTRLCQILKRQMERSVRVNEGSEATPEQLLETINNNAIVSTNAAALATKKADEAMESANVAANASEEINNKIAGFNESFEEMVDEITQEGEKQFQNIQSTGFYMRDDKLYFINSEGEEEEFKSGSGFNLFDTKISDHILGGEQAKGWALQGNYVSGALYPDFYNKCLEEKNSATETETTLGDSVLTMFVNANGHKFFNISDKSIVDIFYDTYGIADFYGIDEENERVFLPRNKYFALTGGVMGNGMTLGLTSGGVNMGVTDGTISSVHVTKLNVDVYGTDVGTSTSANSGDVDKSLGITTDPTKSGIALETNENKYLYYCVGNTVVNNAEIDAGGLVAQMERKANVNFDNVLPEGKASASSWSLPSNRYVDLELGANGSTYTAPANGWAVLSAKLTSSKHISIYNSVTKIGTTAMFNTSSGYMQGFVNVPCKKGDIFEIYHNSPTELITFRFIYAEGEV